MARYITARLRPYCQVVQAPLKRCCSKKRWVFFSLSLSLSIYHSLSRRFTQAPTGGRGGQIQFTYTGPNGNHGGESRFPPSCNHGRSGGHTTKLSFFFSFFFLKKIIYFFQRAPGSLSHHKVIQKKKKKKKKKKTQAPTAFLSWLLSQKAGPVQPIFPL